MDKVLELESKVAELEKRIKFLYITIEKQLEINDELIDNHKKLQDLMIQYANETNRNTFALNVIGNMLKD